MMGFLTMIRLGIAIVVLCVVFFVGRWIILPPMKVFFPSLKPEPFWLGLSNSITAACHQAIPYILIPLAILYLIYKVISKIPLIGKILVRIPPFPDLRRSGIIGLFDGLFGIIFSRASMKDRLKNFARSILQFVQAGFKNSVDTVDSVFKIKNKLSRLNPKIKIPDSINLTGGSKYYDDKPDTDPITNPLMTDEQREIDDKYQLCVYDNTVKITPDMKPEDISYYETQNQIETIKCKVNKVQTSLSFITNKF